MPSFVLSLKKRKMDQDYEETVEYVIMQRPNVPEAAPVTKHTPISHVSDENEIFVKIGDTHYHSPLSPMKDTISTLMIFEKDVNADNVETVKLVGMTDKGMILRQVDVQPKQPTEASAPSSPIR